MFQCFNMCSVTLHKDPCVFLLLQSQLITPTLFSDFLLCSKHEQEINLQNVQNCLYPVFSLYRS